MVSNICAFDSSPDGRNPDITCLLKSSRLHRTIVTHITLVGERDQECVSRFAVAAEQSVSLLGGDFLAILGKMQLLKISLVCIFLYYAVN